MAFYSFDTPPKVTWHHGVLKRIPYYTVYKRNSNLERGRQKIVLPGQEGIIINSWITIERPDGTVITQNKGRTYYSPGPRVIERNSG